MRGIQIELLKRILLIVLAILIFFYAIAPAFGFDILKYLSSPPSLSEDISQPADLSLADEYEGYELSYDGMVLERGASEDNIVKELETRITINNCSSCISCNPVDLDPAIAGPETYNCDECGVCDGVIKPNRFKNCLNCDFNTRKCVTCEDFEEEYYVCKKLKECVYDYYGDKSYKEKVGCTIFEISHDYGTSFNINALKKVLDTCRNETFKVDTGNNMIKDLCNFDNTSFSYYDFERPSDFYINYKIKKDFGSDGFDTLRWSEFSNDLFLTPFYKIGENIFPHYRIFVSINSMPDTTFKILIGRYQSGVPAAIHHAEIGKLTTGSDGFGYAEFSELPEKSKDWVGSEVIDWKNDPVNNYVNGIEVQTDNGVSVLIFGISAIFYPNNVESNQVWSNELRYSNCNFNVNPEPYLKDRPWWAYDIDNLNSSWKLLSGDPDSSIKVFYDSSMPAGGGSSKRGNIKIQLSRLDTDFQRNCKFDILVCSQDAFAEYEDENILSLSEFLMNFNSNNIHKTKSYGNNEIILYNYFKFNLDKDYTFDEIMSAIKTGIRLWESNTFLYDTSYSGLEWLKNNDGIYEGYWNEFSGLLVTYNNDCWLDATSENFISSLNRKFVIGNCKDDICKKNLKIRVAFKYIKPNTFYPERYPLYPIVTFCDISSETSTPSCSCDFWVSGGCGGGSCNSWEERFTRTCTPAGCAVEDYCSPVDSCCDTACGSWTNGQCSGKKVPEVPADCDCTNQGKRYQSRTCPSGATICETTRCISDNNCPGC